MSHSHSSARSTFALTVLRVAVGGVLAAHGSQKLFGWFGGGGIGGTASGMHAMGFRPAKPHAVLAGLGEAGAGTALALGLGTPIAGAGAAITMGTAASTHTPNGFFNADGGFEFPGFLGLTAATFALGGGGSASLDHATGHVFDRGWMRVLALAAIPVVVGVQVRRRRAALAADAAAPRSDEEAPEAAGSTDPAPSAEADRSTDSSTDTDTGTGTDTDTASETSVGGSGEDVASGETPAAAKPSAAKAAPSKSAAAKAPSASTGAGHVPTPAEVVASSPTLTPAATESPEGGAETAADDTSAPSPDAV